MAEFINTIDLLGEEATIDGLLTDTLEEFNDNELTTIGVAGFTDTGLVSVKLPNVTLVSSNSFFRCLSLKYLEFSSQVQFGTYSLYTCNALRTLILRSETLCTYGGLIAAPQLKEGKGGYIYVPRALIDSYKAADIWKDGYAFRALEDYTVDGTIHGALDDNKL